jgi:ferredoxin/flavodoxin---NADP+ reductase
MQSAELNAVVTQRVGISVEMMILRIAPYGWELGNFIPGQFAILGVPGSYKRTIVSDIEEKVPDPDTLIKRPYSITSASNEKEHIEFYISLVRSGTLTPRLFNLKVKDKVWLSNEPRGLFTLERVPHDHDIIMVATGSGLSPYMSMLRTMLTNGNGRNYAVIHGARHSWDLGFISELMTLQHICPNFTYIPVISVPEEEPIPWKGQSGFLDEAWRRRLLDGKWKRHPSPQNAHVFVCGNPLMIESMLPVLQSEGYIEHTFKTPGQIHIERY